jgi:hypothetical protein
LDILGFHLVVLRAVVEALLRLDLGLIGNKRRFLLISRLDQSRFVLINRRIKLGAVLILILSLDLLGQVMLINQSGEFLVRIILSLSRLMRSEFSRVDLNANLLKAVSVSSLDCDVFEGFPLW